MSAAPIGVFDSGVGGLSILAGIHQLLPSEQLIYVADSANAPYGPKGNDFIRLRCEHIMRFFMEAQVKAVVVACNTATAAAIVNLRERYTLPIIGMEPAVKPAATNSLSGVVGVLATQGTISSDKFLHLQNRFAHEVDIISSPCVGLVELIEHGGQASAELKALLRNIVDPMLAKGADTLVLGCTHYSLIKDVIKEVAGVDVSIVDAGDAIARRLQHCLLDEGLLNAGLRSMPVRFFTSGEIAEQFAVLGQYWGGDIELEQLV